MPPSCQRRLASRRAAAPRACAAGANGGAGRGLCLSCRAKPRHLSGVLVPAHGEPVEPRRRSCGGRNLAALPDVGVSLVGAYAPVMPAKAGIQTCGCAARMRSRRTRRRVCGMLVMPNEAEASLGLVCSPLMVSLSNHPVVPAKAGTSQPMSLVWCRGGPRGAHDLVMPAKAGIQTRGCAARMRSRRTRWGVGEGLSCRAKPRHLSGVLVPAHGEPVEPRRVCLRRSCGGRNLAALAPVTPAKAGVQVRASAHGGLQAVPSGRSRRRALPAGPTRECLRSSQISSLAHR